jgi:ADP-ribosylglycohydrolase
MRYSLVNRFRGTLIGAVVGEDLANNNKVNKNIAKSTNPDIWRTMIKSSAESFICQGKFDVDDWTQRCLEVYTKYQETGNYTSSVILAAIPVALFYHENPALLRKNLLYFSRIWQESEVLRDGTLALGYAISQSLTEKINPNTVICQIISFLGDKNSQLSQDLEKVDSLLKQDSGFDKAQIELFKQNQDSRNIALAFYYFLSIIEDFPLAVLQANNKLNNISSISTITGALSGAYNSIQGIPVYWLLKSSSAVAKETTFSSHPIMLELADTLMANWSGVYSLSNNREKLWGDKIAVAAPRVIRLR